MRALKTSTTRQLNNLIEFRQKVYEQILIGAADAQFELLDALLLSEQLIPDLGNTEILGKLE